MKLNFLKTISVTLALLLSGGIINCANKGSEYCTESDTNFSFQGFSICDEEMTYYISNDMYFVGKTIKERARFFFKSSTATKWKRIAKFEATDLRDYSLTDKSLFLLAVKYLEGKSYENSQEILYRYDKTKKELEKTKIFDSLSLKKIHFIDEVNGFATANYSRYARETCLLSTHDGGVSWDMFKIDKYLDIVFFFNQKMYFSSSYIPAEDCKIFILDIDTKTLDSIQPDMSIKDLHVDSNNTIWSLGSDSEDGENERIVLKKIINTNIEEIKEFASDSVSFAKQLYKFNDFIAVLLSKIDYGLFGGLGGTSDKLCLSYDDGKTWEIGETLGNYDHIYNLSFYKDERLVANVGNGKIITCDLGGIE